MTDLAKPATETGFYEFYKGTVSNGVELGVVEWWTYAGTKTVNGTYKMKEAQDDSECYIEMSFGEGKGNKEECMTVTSYVYFYLYTSHVHIYSFTQFSPTIDHQGFVGCYTNTTQCIPVCKTQPKEIWIAAVEFQNK